MREHYDHLNNLLGALPCSNSYRASSDLNSILTKYKKVLDYVNSYNDDYKSVTTVYYYDITDIHDNIEDSLNASTSAEKYRAFEKAKALLQSDITALATLIHPVNEYAVAMA